MVVAKNSDRSLLFRSNLISCLLTVAVVLLSQSPGASPGSGSPLTRPTRHLQEVSSCCPCVPPVGGSTDVGRIMGPLPPFSVSIVEHMKRLDFMASVAPTGTRAVGTVGYDMSVEYIRVQLIDAGYSESDITLQSFSFKNPSTETSAGPSQLSTSILGAYVYNEDFVEMIFSPRASVEGPVQFVANLGCNSEDYSGFNPGRIAVMERGNCTFTSKALLAQEAGASGALVFDPALEGIIPGRIDAEAGIRIPVFTITSQLRDELMLLLPVDTVFMFSNTIPTTLITTNLILEAPFGDPNNTVILGAHLDSVTAGPGINDNGSGSSMILEIAKRLYGWQFPNKIKFSWWAAEEVGLVGSEHYVSNLSQEERDQIVAYLNFDMVASPNYIRSIYKGFEEETFIAKLFESYFDSQSLVYQSVNLNGRSDHGSFQRHGIPTGGVFTGAEAGKTANEVTLYGGTRGVPHDACYHSGCDNITNINTEILREMGNAVVHVMIALASGDTLSPNAAQAISESRSKVSERHPQHLIWQGDSLLE